MGLPEYFSGLASPPSQSGTIQFAEHFIRRGTHGNRPGLPAALLLLDEDSGYLRAEGFAGGGKTLGHQFLLGMIPFTGVYFEHSVDSALVEIGLDVLRDKGFEPYIARERDARIVAQLLQPRLILRPKLLNPSLTAYDALFFRILSAGGELEMTILERITQNANGPALVPRRVLRVPVGDTEFRRFGSGPWLSYLFERSLKEAFAKSLIDSPRAAYQVASTTTPSSPHTESEAVTGTTLFLMLPTFAEKPPAELGAALAASYGYSNLPAFGPGALQRIVQRGVTGALEPQGAVLTTLVEPGSPEHVQVIPGKGLWQVEPIVRALIIDTDKNILKLDMQFTLRDRGNLFAPALLSARCSIEEAVANSDGYWVVTLERAAQAAGAAFFAQNKAPDKASEGASNGLSDKSETPSRCVFH